LKSLSVSAFPVSQGVNFEERGLDISGEKRFYDPSIVSNYHFINWSSLEELRLIKKDTKLL